MVTEYTGADATINPNLNPLGQRAAANSKSMALSTEDRAALGGGGGSSLFATSAEITGTVGAAAADIIDAEAARMPGSYFQNTSRVGSIWVREGANAAVGTGVLVGPRQTYKIMTKGRVSAIRDTNSPSCYVHGLEGLS